MSHTFVRILFLLTFPALIAQYAFFRIKKTQPYPAIIMPDFANAPEKLADPSIREWRLTAHFSDGAQESLTIHDLLYDAPVFYRVNMMRVAFAKQSRIRPEHEEKFKKWLRERIEHVLQRNDLSSIKVQSVRTTRNPMKPSESSREELLYEVALEL